MDFQESTNFFKKHLSYGDIPAIAKKAHCSQTTLRNALRRKSFSELSPKERDAYSVFVDYVDKKIQRIAKRSLAVNDKALQLASTL